MSAFDGIGLNVQEVRILGIPISAVNLSRATDLIASWAQDASARMVFVRESASLMAAVDEPCLRELHEQADLIVADGTPLVWIARAMGFGDRIGRVAGADLVDAVCKASVPNQQTHYFYGGRAGVAEEMARQLSHRYPGLRVVGTFCPPMRDVGPSFNLAEEAMAEVDAVRASGADFVWVGLSSPKQEYWIAKAAPLVASGVFVGVGAAFDFHAGTVRRAPRWMRDNGLEWAHRLYSEPKRLWRRYLILVPRFFFAFMCEKIGWKGHLPGGSSRRK